MSSPERQGIYADYYGHHGALDSLDVLRLYQAEGRFSNRESQFVLNALGKASQRLGSIIVARDADHSEAHYRPGVSRHDPIVGIVRQESGNPLMGEVSGLVVARSHRRLEIPELIVPPVEREIYELGFNEAELYVEADSSKWHPKAWRRRYWRRHHGYEESFPGSWMHKRLVNASGDCIHPPNDFEVPQKYIWNSFRMIYDRLDVKEFQTEPKLVLTNDTVDNFNEAIQESGIDILDGFKLTRNQRPAATPWQYVYSHYNQRGGDSELSPIRRWGYIDTHYSDRSILYLQEESLLSSPNELYSRDTQEISDGYFVVRSRKNRTGRQADFAAIHFDGTDIRQCSQTETNSIMKTLALSAYTFSHDPESNIRYDPGSHTPSFTLWDA